MTKDRKERIIFNIGLFCIGWIFIAWSWHWHWRNAFLAVAVLVLFSYFKDELEEIWKKRREKKEKDSWEKYKRSLTTLEDKKFAKELDLYEFEEKRKGIKMRMDILKKYLKEGKINNEFYERKTDEAKKELRETVETINKINRE